MKISLNLRAKILFIVFIALLIGFGGVATLRIYLAHKSITADIYRAGNERVTLIADALSNPLLTKNFANIEFLAERFCQQDEVHQISILNAAGEVLVSRSSSNFRPDTPNIPFTAPVIAAGKTIGSINMLGSVKRLNQTMNDTYKNVAAMLTLSTSLFGVIIYISLSIFVVKPITRLSHAAELLAHGDYFSALPPESSDEMGNLVRAFSLMRESRKLSEARLRAIFENSPDALIQLDSNGNIINWNDKAQDVFGYKRDETIGASFSMLMPSINRGSGHNENEQVLVYLGESGMNREIVGLHKDGSRFPLEIKTSKIFFENDFAYIVSARDITERKAAELRISHMASHDVLTNLPNRTLLQDRIQQTLAHNRRENLQAAVLFIDLDQFKMINDSLGHDIGDKLLTEAAARLLTVVRGEDTVARQGGDEFIILLATINHPQDAGIIAQKLQDTLTHPFVINGKELHISASIGIAIFPEDGNDMGTLLQNSDIAMYHAKESGRSTYQFFSSKMNELAAEKQALNSDLRHAIDRNQLFLVYQPVVDMASGNIAGMEVLLRWQHPLHGMISPIKFIPLAEECGLIVPIGEWVLISACEQIQEWQKQGYEVPRLAINLSAKQFRQKNLVNVIKRTLAETGVDSRFIGLEITESMLVKNIDEVIDTLLKLSNMGLEISIDDFGTGYSSLSYLKRFPIDKLKIDKSFVDEIATRQDDAAIVKAIIAMAHGLSMKVVTEGVEKQAQLDFLQEHGCEQYQGYIFSKPLPADEIVAKLHLK